MFRPNRRNFLFTASGAIAALAPTARGRIISDLPDGFVACDFAPELESSLTENITASHVAADGSIFIIKINGSDSTVYQSKDGKIWSTVYTFPNQQFESRCFGENYLGNLFISPWGPGVEANTRGLWISKDSGKNWARVLDLSNFADQIGIWGITALADGSMYAGVYSDGAQNACYIYRSADHGHSWTLAYHDPFARHVHDVAADPKNGYVYATIGDNQAPWNTAYVVRSTDRGHTWAKILSSLPQLVPVCITPSARLFATDDPVSKAIYRTTDDKKFQVVLHESAVFGTWMRRDPSTGWVFAGFVTDPADSNPSLARIWVSKNDGATWFLHSQWPSIQTYDGTPFASNISNSKMTVSLIAAGNEQNGALIHTQNSANYMTKQVTATCFSLDGSLSFVGISGADSNVYQSKDLGQTWKVTATFQGQQFESRCFTTNVIGDLFFSPWGGNVANNYRGLWISRDKGRAWSRVLDLSSFANPAGIWGIASFWDGTMYAGVYTETQAFATTIFRSTDYGSTWSQVYSDPNSRHIHDIAVDQFTGVVYATYGDNTAPWNANGILKSSDRGKSWTKILGGLPQMVPVCITPSARLFGADDPIFKGVYRTTDDKTATLVLSEQGVFSFWMRRDPIIGWIYVGFVTDPSNSTPALGKIYISKDDGQTWGLHSLWPSVTAYDGPNFASNIYLGNMAINIQFNGNELYGALIQTC